MGVIDTAQLPRGVSRKQRLRVVARGSVQGVGFRPHVYRLATQLHLKGWVINTPQGVLLEAEGEPQSLETLLSRVESECPPHASIQSLEVTRIAPEGGERFEVRHSEAVGEKTALILPDIATCSDCLRELLDPADRRHRYPFINCTHCGPRFSIIEALPYDRANTAMKVFTMCEECQAEYDDPTDRRFHAQPNACPRCGPHLELWRRDGAVLSAHGEALKQTAEAIRAGRVVAVKGLGGFHLMVAARDEGAVRRLRERKRRPVKPFAVMCPSIESARAICDVSPLEERLLLSHEAPIVLLRARPETSVPIAASIAPGNPNLGVMLPSNPLHHLLMRELGFPVVATSGNRSEEPICTDEHEALERLGDIADLSLVHNRPITRHVDDSIAREVLGGEQVLRRARGCAPKPIHLTEPVPTIVAVGAHLKSTVAVSRGHEVFISQHIGDLETEQAFQAFRRAVSDLTGLCDLRPAKVACDSHPDLVSTGFAETLSPSPHRVQHHIAHVLACMAESGLRGPLLGVSWDGTGHGSDGTVWGGEFFRVTDDEIERVAHLRTFRLPGGEAAVREPRRSALGLLIELQGGDLSDLTDLAPLRAFGPEELGLIRRALRRGVNAPITSSAGRLFDAVASLLGLRQVSTFEGEVAMQLEFAADAEIRDEPYPFGLVTEENGPCVIDWGPTVTAMIDDMRARVSTGEIAARFHTTLAQMIVAVAKHVGEEHVVVTGGCFQSRRLTEQTVERLRAEGFQPHWHRRVPPNDGGIALGQIMAAARHSRGG
jgi:hydrogenase maturation protein HypF